MLQDPAPILLQPSSSGGFLPAPWESFSCPFLSAAVAALYLFILSFVHPLASSASWGAAGMVAGLSGDTALNPKPWGGGSGAVQVSPSPATWTLQLTVPGRKVHGGKCLLPVYPNGPQHEHWVNELPSHACQLPSVSVMVVTPWCPGYLAWHWALGGREKHGDEGPGSQGLLQPQPREPEVGGKPPQANISISRAFPSIGNADPTAAWATLAWQEGSGELVWAGFQGPNGFV